MTVPDALAEAAERERAGRPDQAAAVLDRALAGTAGLLAARGRLALAGLRAREAMRFLGLALALDPADAGSETQLALVAREQGEGERSLRHWRHAAALRPDLAQPWFEIGALHAQAHQFDLAARAFARIPGEVTDAYWLAEIGGTRARLSQARGAAGAMLRRRRGGLGEGERAELARLLLQAGRARAALRVAEGLAEEGVLRFEAERRTMPLAEAAARLRARLPPGEPGEGAFLVADACYQAGEPGGALAVLAGAAEEALPPGVQELLLRCHLALGDAGAALALAGRMIDARPWDPTPPRLALGALLEAGALRPVHDAAAGLPAGFGRIPAVLFRFWDTPEVPAEVRAVMDTWADPHGRLRPVLFDDARAREYIGAHFPASHLRAYARCHHAAMQSDFVRLCFLVREGGIYLDVDEACAQEPEALLRAVSGQELLLVLIGSAQAYANNALIAAVPGHPVLERALAEAVRTIEALAEGERPDIWAATGPGLLTRCLVAELRERGAGGSGMALLTNDAWRRLCAARNSLAYKATAGGNWRMA